jgi:Na+/H+ antiporter NhaD/arsenite permease-like protein
VDHALALPWWSALPFAGMLLAIAIVPLTAEHFWESHRNKGIVAALFAVPTALYLVFALGTAGVHELGHKALEYASFMALLGSLFVISGGIVVRGSLAGTPIVNTALLGLGAMLASWIGTTGASVLLIRPMLRANEERKHKVHVVVFFIFVVSNCGGLLTPLGDPPLFLGFLKGVPFGWTLGLWKQWLFVNGLLLVLFNVWDQIALNREQAATTEPLLEELIEHAPLRIEGAHNFLFLAGIVAVIYAAGSGIGSGGEPWLTGLQEGAMIAIAAAAFATTPARLRAANRFQFGPIIEVAVLFAGIFVTMAPALLLLNQNAASLPVREPWQLFWAAGALSSFLDNAPTYLTFAAAASGLDGIALEGRYLAEYLALGARATETLAAISCGAVFMGAMSYIGNGPNFMVKAIAEENGVQMPSFFGYMGYSIAILIPIFVAATFLFFR